jgi:hypothetical protein
VVSRHNKRPGSSAGAHPNRSPGFRPPLRPPPAPCRRRAGPYRPARGPAVPGHARGPPRRAAPPPPTPRARRAPTADPRRPGSQRARRARDTPGKMTAARYQKMQSRRAGAGARAGARVGRATRLRGAAARPKPAARPRGGRGVAAAGPAAAAQAVGRRRRARPVPGAAPTRAPRRLKSLPRPCCPPLPNSQGELPALVEDGPIQPLRRAGLLLLRPLGARGWLGARASAARVGGRTGAACPPPAAALRRRRRPHSPPPPPPNPAPPNQTTVRLLRELPAAPPRPLRRHEPLHLLRRRVPLQRALRRAVLPRAVPLHGGAAGGHARWGRATGLRRGAGDASRPAAPAPPRHPMAPPLDVRPHPAAPLTPPPAPRQVSLCFAQSVASTRYMIQVTGAAADCPARQRSDCPRLRLSACQTGAPSVEPCPSTLNAVHCHPAPPPSG